MISCLIRFTVKNLIRFRIMIMISAWIMIKVKMLTKCWRYSKCEKYDIRKGDTVTHTAFIVQELVVVAAT